MHCEENSEGGARIRRIKQSSVLIQQSQWHQHSPKCVMSRHPFKSFPKFRYYIKQSVAFTVFSLAVASWLTLFF